MGELSDIELATTVAAEAGRLLLQIRESFGPVGDDPARMKQLKDRGDRESNDLIVERLRSARPGDAILTEEDKDDEIRLSAERVWIVDPLDGTREYGEGRTDFAVHIALWRSPTADQPGSLIATAVDLPAVGLLRSSADRVPAARPLPQDRPIRVVASRTRPPARLAEIVKRWGELLGRPVEQVDVGSVGAKVEEIVAGRAEAYLHDTGFREWDLAAPMGVAQRYGLVLEHWDGSDIVLNQMPPWVRDVMVVRSDLAASLREAIADPGQGATA